MIDDVTRSLGKEVDAPVVGDQNVAFLMYADVSLFDYSRGPAEKSGHCGGT